ncbi:MAG: GerMN domain-containing protein [Chloroflexota bacterium]
MTPLKYLRVWWLSIILVSLTGCQQFYTPKPTSTQFELVEVTVYFTNTNLYATGTPPFEIPVKRVVPYGENDPEAVVRLFFEGPTESERVQGLEAITSGFEGISKLEIEGSIARVYLKGECHSQGATYTVVQPLMKNLLQFEHIKYVKIYDEEGMTWEPEGESNSIPPCLEP